MWARFINIGIGLWLMVSPAVLPLSEKAAEHQYLVGPVMVAFAIIAISEATRNVRYVNTLIGVWLLVAPWVLGDHSTLETLNVMAAGVLITGLSLVKGKIENRFGGGWRSLLEETPEHMQ
ncbi:hypothetical protein GCM10023187_06240 [Nibrella viscosa]|uniref:SPW repeat-containing integral membrane domain-containing protein n=1 Tax=Nibrella viscosa TaxID=1084524 RepID=A0ABP8JWS5_9BACT